MTDSADVAEVPESATEVRWFGVVLLVGHLALTVIGAVALWRIAGGWWVGALAAVLFVLGYVLLWRYLLAPGSRRRLAYRERLTIALVVGPAVVVLGGLTSLWLPALVATSVLILGDALNERSR
ncbi:MAG: hypothetical protein QM713_04910 [Arachnia sp.]